MTAYPPSSDDQRFLLFEVLAAGRVLRTLPAFVEADESLLAQVLEEAAKFVAEVVAPLQAVGDAQGCRLENGRVVTPPGFAQAYRAFRQAGWPSLACAPEDGGQGLPRRRIERAPRAGEARWSEPAAAARLRILP